MQTSKLMLTAVALSTLCACAAKPQSTDIQAMVQQGLELAKPAQAAVEKAFKTRKQGTVTAYSGSGATASNSYEFQFTPNDVVTSIAIGPIPDVQSPANGDGTVTITFAPDIARHLAAPIQLHPGSKHLVPQTGEPVAPLSADAPIIWGCKSQASAAAAFPHLPANCRY